MCSSYGNRASAQDATLVPVLQTSVAEVTAFALSPDGATIAVGSRQGTITLVSAAHNTTREVKVSGRVGCLTYDATGATLYVGTSARELIALDVARLAPIATRRLDGKPVWIDASDGVVGIAQEGGRVELLSATLLPMRQLEAPSLYGKAVRFVALGQKSQELFAAGDDAASVFWNVSRGDAIRTSSPPRSAIGA